MHIDMSPNVYEIWAIGISATLTIIGAGIAAWDSVKALFKCEPDEITTFLTKLGIDGAPLTDSGIHKLPHNHLTAQLHLVNRISEADRARRLSHKRAKRYRVAANLLIFGQYVVGGVLATPSVEHTFLHLKIFGLLVVISSIVKQQYHPDAVAKEAEQKSLKFAAMIQCAEDQLVKIYNRYGPHEREEPYLELADRITFVMNLNDLTSIQPGQVIPAQAHKHKEPALAVVGA
jgi:hypothetical protein